MEKIIKLAFVLLSSNLLAQNDSITKVKFDLSGFLETYYSYDFDQPKTSYKQPFQYNYNRQNSFNLNIALFRAAISYKNVYTKLSVHAGTYVEDNYATEQVKYVNEAFLGMYLNKSKKTSVEVGIMPSYIGFESATTHKNLTTTRSLLAENSPYYMTGIKLSHQLNNKWVFSGLITNGWQRIEKLDSKIPPAFGTQLVYKPNENDVWNWSTFIGKEFYGTTLGYRYFSNLYWDTKWNSKWRSIIGLDYGIQDISSNSDTFVNWYSPIVITQYRINLKWYLAYRLEYYHDSKNIMVSYNYLPFKNIGNSLNLDFLPLSKFKIRTEGKWYHATENIFDDSSKKNNFSLTTTISFEF